MRAITADSLPTGVLDVCETWARLIVAARKAQGLSQDELRQDAGISRSTLVEIEAGSPRVQFAHWLVVLDRLDLLDAFRSVPAAQLSAIASAVKLPSRRRHG